jgi:glycerophosphoryl diester phosphodiesterase
MSRTMKQVISLVLVLVIAGLAHAGNGRIDEIRRKLTDPDAGIFVIAHRGCHNPVASKGFDSLPENSLSALDRCVALGVDMMETDIHRTRDGGLVIMHDDTVDRTTDGTGAVADLTMAEIRRLHLRRNMGAPTAMALTSEHVPTLDELLARAKGRILINLDIKGPIYREVIDAAVHDGMANDVVAKRPITPSDPAVADTEPFSGVPFAPILDGRGEGVTPPVLRDIVSRQTSGKRRIVMVELSLLSVAQAQAVIEVARADHVRVMSNTLSGVVGVVDRGTDVDALRSPDQVWGWLIDAGVTAFQTDEPAVLLEFLGRRGAHRSSP